MKRGHDTGSEPPFLRASKTIKLGSKCSEVITPVEASTMFAKVVLASFLALTVVASPDRRPANNYQAPQQQSYQPPQQQSYQPPQQQTYQPPQQQTYQAPQQQTYQPPQQQTYQAPQPSYSNRQPTYEDQEGMPFDFGYAVQDQYSGNDFGHNSNSDGKVTTGEYRVLLPDGRTQIVKYTADNYNGYQAEVSYEGEARPYEPQPAYSQPRNTYQQPEQPRNTYQQPEQPRNTYQQPEPPRNTYQQPRQQQGYN